MLHLRHDCGDPLGLTITGLSIVVTPVIGAIELGGLIAQHLNLWGSFWTWFENININVLGFLIVGMFIATWAIALAFRHFGHVEEPLERER